MDSYKFDFTSCIVFANPVTYTDEEGVQHFKVWIVIFYKVQKLHLIKELMYISAFYINKLSFCIPGD